MLKHSFPTIEQFAAFLDDNLSQNEMLQFSQIAEHDSVLHQLLDANAVVDNALAGFTDADLKLPPEIVCSDFELPTIPAEGNSPLLKQTQEPIDDMLVAAAACADDDISMFSGNNPNDYLTIGDEFQFDSSNYMQDNDGFDNCEDLSGSIFDDP